MSDFHQDYSNENALLWVNCATVTNRAPEVSGAVRQHVMLNYLATQFPLRSQPLQARPNRQSRKWEPIPRPKASLIIPEDNEVLKAVWWHNYAADTPLLDWKRKFKLLQDDALWDLAQDDLAMREVFMTFAANKEASIRGWEGRTRSYLVHKGRAIRQVSQRVSLEGRNMDFAVITAIALLSKAAFTEGDVESAEMHASAVSQLVRHRMATMPKFLWLLAVWSDLKLTGVSVRAPRLPLFVHPEFQVAIPQKLRLQAVSMAESHRCCLSGGSMFSEDFLVLLLTKIFALALVYDTDDMDWAAATAVSYQTAHFLACAQHEHSRTVHFDQSQERGAVYFMVARLQFWGMLAPFVEPAISQAFILQETQQSLFQSDAATFFETWTAGSACNECLLWILVNVYTSISLYPPRNASGTLDQFAWLSTAMRLAKDQSGIKSFQEFERCLRRMPYSKNWNGLCFNRVPFPDIELSSTKANKKPLAIVGDAAHSTTAWQGSGGGLCIEDTLILSSLLGRANNPDEAVVALKVYDQLRRPRTQQLVESSNLTGSILTGKYEKSGLDSEKLREVLAPRWDSIIDFDNLKHRDEAIKLMDAELSSPRS